MPSIDGIEFHEQYCSVCGQVYLSNKKDPTERVCNLCTFKGRAVYGFASNKHNESKLERIPRS
jgi:hypothetical protein